MENYWYYANQMWISLPLKQYPRSSIERTRCIIRGSWMCQKPKCPLLFGCCSERGGSFPTTDAPERACKSNGVELLLLNWSVPEFRGQGSASQIASVFLGSGLSPSGVSWRPINGIFVWACLTFCLFSFGFHFMHLVENDRSFCLRLFYASSVVSPNPAIISSDFYSLEPLHKFVHGSLPYFWSRTDAKRHLKPTVSSKGSVESSFVAGLIIKFVLPESIFCINYCERLCFVKLSSDLFYSGHWVVLLLNRFVQIPWVQTNSNFVLETHSVGSVTGVMTFCCTNSSNCSLIFGRTATGTLLGGWTFGFTLLSVIILNSPGSSPSPSNTSLYLWRHHGWCVQQTVFVHQCRKWSICCISLGVWQCRLKWLICTLSAAIGHIWIQCPLESELHFRAVIGWHTNSQGL